MFDHRNIHYNSTFFHEIFVRFTRVNTSLAHRETGEDIPRRYPCQNIRPVKTSRGHIGAIELRSSPGRVPTVTNNSIIHQYWVAAISFADRGGIGRPPTLPPRRDTTRRDATYVAADLPAKYRNRSGKRIDFRHTSVSTHPRWTDP